MARRPNARMGPRAEFDEPIDPRVFAWIWERHRQRLDEASIVGLLEPWSPHARAVLGGLLSGRPLGVSCVVAGISQSAVLSWQREDAEFREAIGMARQLGFSAVYEAEVYDRALDRGDRGSARLLELILKRGEPEFRERHQMQVEVIRVATEQERGFVAGWQESPRTVMSPTPELE